MKRIFLLSGENLDLARTEVLALAKTDDYWMYDNVLYLPLLSMQNEMSISVLNHEVVQSQYE